MRLLTDEVKAKLPPLYSQENVPDPLVVVKYFNPTGIGTWYITEGSEEDGDFILFGLCDLGYPELGYVSLNELQAVKGRFGLGIERDLHWSPRPLSEVKNAIQRQG